MNTREKSPGSLGGTSGDSIANAQRGDAKAGLAQACAPADSITILRHPTRVLAKQWRADGSISAYDAAKQFYVEHVEVNGIDDLSGILTDLAADPHACVIRGRYKGDAAAKEDPEYMPGKARRIGDNFDDVRHHWVLIEVDDYEPLTADPVTDPAEAIAEFVSLGLPEPFNGAACHWQLSNSAGSATNKGKLKAHLWFWLATPYSSEQLREWAKVIYLKADKSVFNKVQVHYTSAPVFEEGVVDPVPVRSGFVPGDEVDLHIDEGLLAFKGERTTRRQRVQGAIQSDPIAHHLYDQGMVKSQRPDGGLNIICPRQSHHSTESGETSTIYYTAHTGANPTGAFVCQHDHCRDVGQPAFYEALGYPRSDALTEFDDLTVGPNSPAEPTGIVFPPPLRGPMADAVAATLAVAPKPQPELTTLAAVIGMASATPGAYYLPGGGRLNLYGCGVAETAEGKEVPRRLAIEFASAAGSKLLGKPASGQGLEDVLDADKAMLVEIDEVAHLFVQANARNAPPHLVELGGVFLKLFSASSTTYHTRVRAGGKNTVPARSIEHPTLNLIGFATPEKLGEALGISDIEDGLLGRHLFAFGRSGVVPRRSSGRLELPEGVRARALDIEAAVNACKAKAAFGTGDDSLDTAGIEIRITSDADARLDELLGELHARHVGASTPFAKALFGRSFEKVERVAGVLAVWDSPQDPVITLEHVAWAEKCLAASDDALLRFVGGYMHGGQVQADAARVLKNMRRALEGGFAPKNSNEDAALKKNHVPWSLLMRATKLDKRRFDEAVDNLIGLGEVEKVSKNLPTSGGGVKAATWLKLAV